LKIGVGAKEDVKKKSQLHAKCTQEPVWGNRSTKRLKEKSEQIEERWRVLVLVSVKIWENCESFQRFTWERGTFEKNLHGRAATGLGVPEGGSNTSRRVDTVQKEGKKFCRGPELGQEKDYVSGAGKKREVKLTRERGKSAFTWC